PGPGPATMPLATDGQLTRAMTTANAPRASAAGRRRTARPNDGKPEHQRGKDRDGSSSHGMATASDSIRGTAGTSAVSLAWAVLTPAGADVTLGLQPRHQVRVARTRDDRVELRAVVGDQADTLDPHVKRAPALDL